jgi:hypothetical protein
VHPGHAHHAVTRAVVLPDALEQALVLPLSRARRALGPCIEAAGRDLQAAAHELNGIDAATALNRLVLHFDSLAKNAAASRKKSRSRFTLASSRFMAMSS